MSSARMCKYRSQLLFLRRCSVAVARGFIDDHVWIWTLHLSSLSPQRPKRASRRNLRKAERIAKHYFFKSDGRDLEKSLSGANTASEGSDYTCPSVVPTASHPAVAIMTSSSVDPPLTPTEPKK